MSKDREGANEASTTKTQSPNKITFDSEGNKHYVSTPQEVLSARKNKILALLCVGGFICLRCGIKIQSSLSRGELVSRYLKSRVNFLCAKCHKSLFYRCDNILFPRLGRRFEVYENIYDWDYVLPESSAVGSLGDRKTGRVQP